MQRMGRVANAQLDYHNLPRRRLQHLCKKHGIPANKTNLFMADALTELFKNSGSSKDNSAPATPARSQIDESQSSQCTTEDNFQPGSGRKGEAAPAGDTDEAHSIDKNSICTTVAVASDAREETDDAHSIVKNEETNPCRETLAAPARDGKDDGREQFHTSLEDVKQVLVSELDVKLVVKNHVQESLLVLNEMELDASVDIKGLLPEQNDNAIKSTVRPNDELANAELVEAAEIMVDSQYESYLNSGSTFPFEKEHEPPKQSTSIAQPSTASPEDENEKKNQRVQKFQDQEDDPGFDARSTIHESPDAEPHEAAKTMVDVPAIFKDENVKKAEEDYTDSDQTSDRIHEGPTAAGGSSDAMVLETLSDKVETSGIVSSQWKEMLERAIRKAKHRSSYKESPFLKRSMLNRSLVRARLKRAELLTRRRMKRNDEAGRGTAAAEGRVDHAPQPVFGRKRFMEKAMAESAKKRKQMGLAQLESVTAFRTNEIMSASETCILELQESRVEDSSASNENQKTTGSICGGRVAKAQQKKHQEQFKTPLKGKSHQKAKVIAIKLAATQRDVILRSRRGMGTEPPL